MRTHPIRYDRPIMMHKRPTLGRGLADLLGQSAAGRITQAAEANEVPKREELAKLPLDLLQRGRYQPRTDLRQESLEELASSIRVQGVIQPIVVRPLEVTAQGEPQRYEIIAGERRWRAAQLAGLTEIAAVIRHIPDEAAIAVALIENIQRENLNPLEEARALSRLINEFQMTHLQAAEAVGRSRAAVSNLLRLLELPNEVCTLVDSRELEMGHARALLGLANRRQQSEVGALVAKKGISVRETEALVRRLQRPTGAGRAQDDSPTDPNVDKRAQDVAEKLGASVAIQHAASGRGKPVISYNSLDELDGILAHIQ
jgi:ParB family transcriptional regulator, chromosome partitioning protein